MTKWEAPPPLRDLRVPDEIQQLVSGIDQHIKVQVGLAASVDDVWDGEGPMIEQGVRGFCVSAQVQLISNVKKALMAALKDEESQRLAPILMMASPAFMVGVSGSLDVTYDDFDEIREHPMAGPAMVSCADLFEGVMGMSRDEALAPLERRGDLAGAKSGGEGESEGMQDAALDALAAVHELADNLAPEGRVEARVLLKDRGLVEYSLESPGLQKPALLGLALGPYKVILEQIVDAGKREADGDGYYDEVVVEENPFY